MKNKTANRSIHSSKGKKGFATAIITGVIVSVIITLILTAVEATLLEKQVLQLSSTGKMAVVIWIVAAALGALTSGKIAEKQKLITAIATGAVYSLVLLLITGIAYGAHYDGVLKGLLLMIMAATVAGILLAGNRGGKVKKHRFR